MGMVNRIAVLFHETLTLWVRNLGNMPMGGLLYFHGFNLISLSCLQIR